jgi:hypothetical protein
MPPSAKILYVVLPWVLACGGAPSPMTEPPPAPPPTVAAAAAEFDLDAWIADVEQAGVQGREAVDVLLADVTTKLGADSRLDEALDDACAGTPTSFGGVRRLDGQIDDDADVETAVLVLLAVTDRMGEAERCEEYWLGVFDPSSGGMKLVLRSHRIVYHCLFDDREAGVAVEFVSPSPGPDAALRMELQDVGACGTLVNYRYRRFVIRGGLGGAEVEREAETESVSYDRMEGLEEPAP